MTGQQTRIAWAFLAVALIGLIWSSTAPFAQQTQSSDRQEVAEPVSPETLIPQGSVLFAQCDGSAAHQDVLKATAAYRAFEKSGLLPTVRKAVVDVLLSAGPAAGPVLRSLRQVEQNGLSFGVSLPKPGQPPIPSLTIVLHQAADLERLIGPAIQGVAAQEGIEFTTQEIAGQKVTSGIIPVPGTPGVELGWWTKGTHLVIAAGFDAVRQTAAVSSGNAENLQSHPLWKKFGRRPETFTRTNLMWFEVDKVFQMFSGFPIPESAPDNNGQPRRVGDLLAVLGLDGLGAIVVQSGIDGEAVWSDRFIEYRGQPRGLFALGQTKGKLTLSDIPKLPANVTRFQAGTADWSAMADASTRMTRDLIEFLPDEPRQQFEEFIEQATDGIEFDVRRDFLDGLGDKSCFYLDDNQAAFSQAYTFAFSLENRKTVQTGLRKMLRAIAARIPNGVMRLRETKVRGYEIIEVTIGLTPGQDSPLMAFAVGEDWLVGGNLPQAVEAFLLRQEGKLPSWSATDFPPQTTKNLPKEFDGMVGLDVRPAYQIIASLLPPVTGFIKLGLRESGMFPRDVEIPLDVVDLPPAELVVHSLFPTMTTVEKVEGGYRQLSRGAATDPTGVAIIGGTAVGIAVLLPAIQAARNAARLAQSRNNLQNLSLATMNYASTHDEELPRGTLPNDELRPTQRMSWIVSILTFLDQEAVFRSLKQKEAWDSDANKPFSEVQIPTLINPAASPTDVVAPTHYVGITGYGKDCETLPAGHARAGVFGYDRKVSLDDISTGDGTSQTLMISEASEPFGPWSAGGSATIRGFKKQPYVDGPDGIGSQFDLVFNAAFADGSVQALSKSIDPTVLEAMSTYQGNDPVDMNEIRLLPPEKR
ncbi:DUF1559 family PulG-like putative transporter [Thalassoroseus pseudoceratinae]|uniref:DUF1559 family PulG-like putative transporter n=1 Tax=Thalassoroseus pseudoceratinae TaxID=2713176 RepID=UPI00141F8D9D|nr:DUF1559 domain-containing protein [Thalassoroseus pseudoceratinae]